MPRPRLDRPNYRLRLRGGRYIVAWTEAGRTRSVSTWTDDPATARRYLAQFVAGRERPAPPPQPTIGTILDGYLADRKGRVEAYDRLEFAATVLRRHLGELEPQHMGRRTFWDRRRRDRVSDGTIIREGKTLRAALAWAVREEWLAQAPYVALPEAPPPRERWLSREEAERLVAECRTPHVRLFVLLALHTAARKGAIRDLTWDRVDFERRLIHYAKPGRRQTKKRRQTVPINDALIGALQAARQVATTAYVIEYRGRAAGNIRRAFERAAARAGVAPCSPHVLRHTAATWMVLAGVPIAEVARMLGDTEATVERVYGKHSPAYLRRAADALAGRVFESVTQKPPLVTAKNRVSVTRTKGVTG